MHTYIHMYNFTKKRHISPQDVLSQVASTRTFMESSPKHAARALDLRQLWLEQIKMSSSREDVFFFFNLISLSQFSSILDWIDFDFFLSFFINSPDSFNSSSYFSMNRMLFSKIGSLSNLLLLNRILHSFIPLLSPLVIHGWVKIGYAVSLLVLVICRSGFVFFGLGNLLQVSGFHFSSGFLSCRPARPPLSHEIWRKAATETAVSSTESTDPTTATAITRKKQKHWLEQEQEQQGRSSAVWVMDSALSTVPQNLSLYTSYPMPYVQHFL